jgi:hypothetical protein
MYIRQLYISLTIIYKAAKLAWVILKQDLD